MANTNLDLRIAISVIVAGLTALSAADPDLTAEEQEIITLLTGILNGVLNMLPAASA
jgi:hypothetical protein